MKNNIFKKITFLGPFVSLLMTVLISCNSDDLSDNLQPELKNFKTAISSAPNFEFKFEGEIADDNGIKSIQITYSNWNIDKLIVLNETPKEFTLNYKFLVPENELPSSSHSIKLNITDIGGNISTIDVIVTLDLDVTKPVLEIKSPLTGGSYKTGDKMPVNIIVTDDFEIESLHIKSNELNVDTHISIGNGEKNYNYNSEIEIPTGIDGTVIIEATATDGNGNESKKEVSITVGANIVFTNIYLVGGSTWYGWNPEKATKMWQDPNNDQLFIVEFYYKTNDDVKFIAQLDWAPYNWGLDPNNNTRIINAQNSVGIGFPNGNGYYRVRFNPYNLTYTYEKMSNNTPVKDEMFVVGKGFVGYRLDWNPADAIPMKKDSNNPYVFSVELEFSSAVDLKYLGQNNGWGPYDAGFVTGGPMQLPVNYVKGVVGGGTPDLKFNGQPGNYIVTYDYFLLRTTIQPK